jgi:uncharacterized protein DUF6152
MNVAKAVRNAIAVVVMCATLSAHHSTVAYLSQSVALQNATIEKVLWSNPHIILAFSVKAASGAATTWSVETGSPTSVAQLGWNRNSVKVGDKVTVELYPAKNGAHVGRLKKLIYSDGRELLDTQNPTVLKP